MYENNFLHIRFNIFEGTPPIKELFGKLFVTTLPAAITQLSPITTPSKIVTFAPIQQLDPIFTPSLETPCSLIKRDLSK